MELIDSRLKEQLRPLNEKPWAGMTVEQLCFLTEKSSMDWVVDGDKKAFEIRPRK